MVGKSSKRLVLLIPNSESHYGRVLFPTVKCCGHSGSQELAVEGGGRRRLIHMFRFKQRMTTQSLGQSTFEECVIRRSFSGSPGTFQRHLLAVLTISRSSVWQHIWSNRCGWVGSWHSKVGKESNRQILANMFQFSQYVENYSVFSIICGELYSFLNMWRIIQCSQYVENYSVFSTCRELFSFLDYMWRIKLALAICSHRGQMAGRQSQLSSRTGSAPVNSCQSQTGQTCLRIQQSTVASQTPGRHV